MKKTINPITINEDKGIYLIKLDTELYLFVKEIVDDYKQGNIRNYEFENVFGFNIKQILSYGDPKEISKKLLDFIIPHHKQQLTTKDGRHSYKCYVNDTSTVVLHEDTRSSWSCLMILLNHPENVLIYKTN